MKYWKTYAILISILSCLLLLPSGCSKKPEETTSKTIELQEIPESIKLELKYVQDDTESFKLNTLARRKVSLETTESQLAENFQDGQSTDKIEIVFDRKIQSTDSNGNAIAQITIKQLKYFSEVKDNEVLNYDSSSSDDPNNAFDAMIGHSYTIEITPAGQVTQIVDANDIRMAIKEKPSNFEIARSLLLDESIKKRHTLALPIAEENELKQSNTWSNIETFDFGLMGSQSYKRIYTLDSIEKNESNLIATASMDAIPSIEGIKDLSENEGASVLEDMMDKQYTYEGQMELDITNNSLIKYKEDLITQWLIVPPGSATENSLNAVKMVGERSYLIEKISQ